MTSGVYQIVNTVNGKRYIGSSVNIPRRQRKHINHLRAGTHHNIFLQRAWRLHGEQAFQFSVITLCQPEQLIASERLEIERLRPEFNLSPVAGNQLGFRHSELSKQKMAARMMGNKQTLGFKFSDAVKQKMSASHVGKYPSEETRLKMSRQRIGNSYKLGKKESAESRLKKSIAHKLRWAKIKEAKQSEHTS